MNILFFLTPKSDVAFIYEDETLKEALDKMERYQYAAMPIITRQGRYVGTITEGDLLWGIKNKFDFTFKGLDRVQVTEVPAGCAMEDLLGKAMNQNFVPVLDDQKNFIGIVTRKEIIKYLSRQSKRAEA